MQVSEPRMNRMILDDDEVTFWVAPEPPVVGLVDVARGRDVQVPTTVYKLPGDSASGVMGLLTEAGEFRPKVSSKFGREVTLNQDGETFTVETAWDGAIPEPHSLEPIGHRDNDSLEPIFQGSSKGLLLGNYAVTGELWKTIRRGTGHAMNHRRGRGEDTSPSQDNAIRMLEAA